MTEKGCIGEQRRRKNLKKRRRKGINTEGNCESDKTEI